MSSEFQGKMPGNLSIRLEGIGKRYRLGMLHNRALHFRSFRDTLAKMLRAPFKRLTAPPGKPASPHEYLWALSNISFDVKRGEVLGIIGANGAGKSTLLKILSRITEPTEGRIQLQGRVSSLLEVGVGFHPELTARENVYLNGAIMNMRKKEIDNKFDEIVAFAEVEKFLDTPIKRFSSGMYVRLAFAVAAHLNPEILLVDEVLAVGDVDFQKKCIGTMSSVAKSGRTVFIVSHNMAIIESLCKRSLLLDKGQVVAHGPTAEVISQYLKTTKVEDSTHLSEQGVIDRKKNARFLSIRLKNTAGEIVNQISMGEGLTIELPVFIEHEIRQPWITVRIRSQLNQLMSHIASRESGYPLGSLQGEGTIVLTLKDINLLPGRYFLDIWLSDMTTRRFHEVTSATYFDVTEKDIFNSGLPVSAAHGLIFFKNHWEFRQPEAES